MGAFPTTAINRFCPFAWIVATRLLAIRYGLVVSNLTKLNDLVPKNNIKQAHGLPNSAEARGGRGRRRRKISGRLLHVHARATAIARARLEASILGRPRAQNGAHGKSFRWRVILVRLLEGTKLRRALYIIGYFSVDAIYRLCWSCSYR
jgi:hypothetical protein